MIETEEDRVITTRAKARFQDLNLMHCSAIVVRPVGELNLYFRRSRSTVSETAGRY